MENNLFYIMPTGTNYFNFAYDLSRVNSKNEEVTSRDGHVYGYMAEFSVSASAAGTVILSTAPNSWRMRNSFRKFHAYRDIMFRNAGVDGSEMGRYGRTIRPLLDYHHKADGTNTADPLSQRSDNTSGTNAIEGGEWTYSRLAVTPAYTDEAPIDPTENYWADSFTLHICEENNVADNSDLQSGFYKSVGMIHSYNIDRQDVVTPEADTGEVIEGPSNPLAQLISSGNQAVGEVIDITEDQELEAPPYDIQSDGDSMLTTIKHFGASTAEWPTYRFSAFIPAGLARLTVTGGNTNINVRIVGKVLCKDMA
jgi:hypothetical protein